MLWWNNPNRLTSNEDEWLNNEWSTPQFKALDLEEEKIT